MAFCDWLYRETSSTWNLGVDSLAVLLFRYLVSQVGMLETTVADTIREDYSAVGRCDVPRELRPHLSVDHTVTVGGTRGAHLPPRQRRHRSSHAT